MKQGKLFERRIEAGTLTEIKKWPDLVPRLRESSIIGGREHPNHTLQLYRGAMCFSGVNLRRWAIAFQ